MEFFRLELHVAQKKKKKNRQNEKCRIALEFPTGGKKDTTVAQRLYWNRTCLLFLVINYISGV